jgi:hypothetical protein
LNSPAVSSWGEYGATAGLKPAPNKEVRKDFLFSLCALRVFAVKFLFFIQAFHWLAPILLCLNWFSERHSGRGVTTASQKRKSTVMIPSSCHACP